MAQVDAIQAHETRAIFDSGLKTNNLLWTLGAAAKAREKSFSSMQTDKTSSSSRQPVNRKRKPFSMRRREARVDKPCVQPDEDAFTYARLAATQGKIRTAF